MITTHVAFEDAYKTAEAARRKVMNHGLFRAACLLRQALPGATAITVDVEAVDTLVAVHANDRTVWHVENTDASALIERAVSEAGDVVRDSLSFGRNPGVLSSAGWRRHADDPDLYDVDLPDTSRAGRSVGTAHTATPAGLLEVTATLDPGNSSFTIEGLSEYAPETRDRVRYALLNSGYEWPDGALTVRVGLGCTKASPSFELAIVCAILAAAGRIEQAAVDGPVLLGALGFIGGVYPSPAVPAAAHAAACAGRQTLVLPVGAPPVAAQMPGLTVITVRTVRQAIAALTGEPVPEA
ncbi:MAG TPA: magnesium chelatase domain-containing protein [Streptomyces sp.]|nr:magnesium chelatase domain-containing protein [Streptomyces sp.]